MQSNFLTARCMSIGISLLHAPSNRDVKLTMGLVHFDLYSLSPKIHRYKHLRIIPNSSKWSGSDVGNAWIILILSFSNGEISLWWDGCARVLNESSVRLCVWWFGKLMRWNSLLYNPTERHFWHPFRWLNKTVPTMIKKYIFACYICSHVQKTIFVKSDVNNNYPL